MNLTTCDRALIEMGRFGALSRQKGGWKSCNGVGFYECTVLALLSRGLAIYSINKKKPGCKFVRLSDAGIKLARNLTAEYMAKKAAEAAYQKTFAEVVSTAPVATGDQTETEIVQFLSGIADE